MRVLNNRLSELVAQKERWEGRKITNAVIAEETGLGINTVSHWMNNSVEGYKSKAILALCEWLSCEVKDLLVIEDVAGTNAADLSHMAPLFALDGKNIRK